jgi:hypothetical protein
MRRIARARLRFREIARTDGVGVAFIKAGFKVRNVLTTIPLRAEGPLGAQPRHERSFRLEDLLA